MAKTTTTTTTAPVTTTTAPAAPVPAPGGGHPIPCYRCGAPVAHGVQALIDGMGAGTVGATKAYYVHGTGQDGDNACGNVAQPGGSSVREVYAPFRKAVKAATDKALTAEGYVRILHVPAPVKPGTAEHTAALAQSAALQARLIGKVKADPNAPMADGCMFVRMGSGEWADKAAVAAENARVAGLYAALAAERATAAPAPVVPAPMAAPAPMPMAPAPMAPVAMFYVTTKGGTVEHVAEPVARAMLADGRAIGVHVNGVWAVSL